MTKRPSEEKLEIHPVLPFQKQLWLMQRMAPDVGVANVSARLRWEGPLDLQALQGAASDFVVRHPFLRANLEPDENGELVQVVRAPRPVDVLVRDVQHLSGESQAEEVARILSEVSETPLKTGMFPSVRCVVVRSSSKAYDVSFVFSHLTSDGLSMAVLSKEFLQAYEWRIQNLPLQWTNEVPARLADTLSQVSVSAGESSVRYQNGLPPDLPPQPMPTYRGKRISFQLTDHQSSLIIGISRQIGVSPFVTWVSILQVVLGKYSHEFDFTFDVVRSGRTSEQRRHVGPFFETVGMNLTSTAQDSFSCLLHRNQVVVETMNQAGPGELPLSTERSKMLIDYQSALRLVEMHNGVKVLAGEWDNGAAVAELCFGIRKNKKSFSGHVKFDADLYSPEAIERFLSHVIHAIELVSVDPECPIRLLDLRTESEKTCLEQLNSNLQRLDRERLVDQQFFVQAAATPDSVAIVAGEQSLTYAELKQEVLRFRVLLQQNGVGPHDRVGVFLPKNVECVAAMIAVMSLGAAFVPIAGETHPNRQNMVVEQADLKCVIAGNNHEDVGANCLIVSINESLEFSGTGDDFPVDANRSADDPAYVLFTSGSTGVPKGVEVTHGNLANFFLGIDQLEDGQSPGCWLSATSIGFDISMFELMWTLARGFKVVLHSPEKTERGNQMLADFSRLVEQHQVTHFQCTPALMQLLLRDSANRKALRSLERIYIGGDVLEKSLADEVAAVTKAAVYNMYGPTETTIWSTAWQVEKTGRVLIGKPLANQTVNVLDESMQPALFGELGELYIGGLGVARGYLNDSQLTDASFIDHESLGRIYRTGDLVRMQPSGDLEFVNRRDNQVKILGHRFELGEIEAALNSHACVESCVVVMDKQEKRISAFVRMDSLNGSNSESELAVYLESRLPEYMLPKRYVFVDEFPLNSSGKIDRRVLASLESGPRPSVRQGQNLNSPDVPAASGNWQQQTLNQLVEIIQDELSIDRLPLDSKWTELQISSLDLVGLVVKVEQEMGLSFPVANLFHQSSISETLQQALGSAEQHESRAFPRSTGSANEALETEIEEGVI